MKNKRQSSWWSWWPLALVLGATAVLWKPVIQLFWYRDDYPTLYWLLHPDGPSNPADVGDYKLAIYHGLLEVHWPAIQLFGTDVTAHRTGQLLLLLLAVGVAYVLFYRLSRSHLLSSLASLILASMPLAIGVADRVSTAYQGYLSVAFVAGVLIALLAWAETGRRGWYWTAATLFVAALYFTGVRLHAAFIGIGMMAAWFVFQSPGGGTKLRPMLWWWFGGTAVATVLMVVLSGLGRNTVLLAPTFLTDLVTSFGHLIVPSHGLEQLFAPLGSNPGAIVSRYQLLVGIIGGLVTVVLLTIPTQPRWTRWLSVSVAVALAIGFGLGDPDVSQGDRTVQSREWLGLFAGLELILLAVGLALGWRADSSRNGRGGVQLAFLGLVWAMVAFLPPFLVQPGSWFGTADRYYIGSTLPLALFWLGLSVHWWRSRQWFGLGFLVVLIALQGVLAQNFLTREQTSRAQPAKALYAQLGQYNAAFSPPSRIVFLAQPSTEAAYHLHEAFAASTIPDEAIFTVLFDAPYDTRQIAISTLGEVAAEVNAGNLPANRVFVFGYGSENGLVDLSSKARLLLPTIDTDLAADKSRAELLKNVR